MTAADDQHPDTEQSRPGPAGRALGAAVLATVSIGVVAMVSSQMAPAQMPDYGPGSHAVDTQPAGTPTQLDARVTDTVRPADLPGGDVMGLARPVGGPLMALSRATATGADGAGALAAVDTTTGDTAQLLSIDIDQQYVDSARSQPQVAAGWTLGTLPELSDSALLVGSGSRFGVLDEYQLGGGTGSDQPGRFAGVVTDQPGSPTGPITGACSDAPGSSDPVTWTTSGSEVIERREYPTSQALGTAPQVQMLASPMMALRPQQSQIPQRQGSQALPLLGPAHQLAVGGLRSLNCLDAGAVQGLRERTGMSELTLRSEDGASQTTSTVLLAVVDRELSQQWFDRGSVPGEGIRAEDGQHYTGGLIGEPTATGEHRLDAVVIDSVTGVAVAGVHLTGAQVPDDAQVSAMVLDATGTGGWAALAGSDELLRFEF